MQKPFSMQFFSYKDQTSDNIDVMDSMIFCGFSLSHSKIYIFLLNSQISQLEMDTSTSLFPSC